MSEAQRASAVPASPEQQLFQAYGQIKPGQRGMFRVTSLREEPCACGGIVALLSIDTVQDAVDRHNATPEHLAWRANQ